MACDYPLRAFWAKSVDDTTGARSVTLRAADAQEGLDPFEVPCGTCDGCRLGRAREWSIRINHEAKCWPHNAFVTLTFSDEHLPENYSVDVRDPQLFLKRLRKSAKTNRIRFFGCGEYGDLNLRPHYHLILFNHYFPDQKLYKNTPHGPLYTSEALSDLWPYGHSTVGAVTPASAGYVARYSLKKVGGNRAADHYTRIHPLTGKVHTVKPEFLHMSRRPGIGSSFVNEFKSDFYPSGFLVVDGAKAPVPRFYLQRLEEDEQQQLKDDKWRAALPHRHNNTPERRKVRMQVRAARMRNLKRSL